MFENIELVGPDDELTPIEAELMPDEPPVAITKPKTGLSTNPESRARQLANLNNTGGKPRHKHIREMLKKILLSPPSPGKDPLLHQLYVALVKQTMTQLNRKDCSAAILQEARMLINDFADRIDGKPQANVEDIGGGQFLIVNNIPMPVEK